MGTLPSEILADTVKAEYRPSRERAPLAEPAAGELTRAGSETATSLVVGLHADTGGAVDGRAQCKPTPRKMLTPETPVVQQSDPTTVVATFTRTAASRSRPDHARPAMMHRASIWFT